MSKSKKRADAKDRGRLFGVAKILITISSVVAFVGAAAGLVCAPVAGALSVIAARLSISPNGCLVSPPLFFLGILCLVLAVNMLPVIAMLLADAIFNLKVLNKLANETNVNNYIVFSVLLLVVNINILVFNPLAIVAGVLLFVGRKKVIDANNPEFLDVTDTVER